MSICNDHSVNGQISRTFGWGEKSTNNDQYIDRQTLWSVYQIAQSLGDQDYVLQFSVDLFLVLFYSDRNISSITIYHDL